MLVDVFHAAKRRLPPGLLRLHLVAVANAAEGGGHLAPELVRLDRDRASVLAQHPRGECADGRVLGDEDTVFDPADGAVCALHPPGGVAAHLDARLADDVADQPVRAAAQIRDVEVGRRPEVPLAPGCKPDVAFDARDAERAQRIAVEVAADDVPLAAVVVERVRIECPLRVVVARDRPVVELHRALLRDRPLELRQPAGHLHRVIGVEHLDAARGLGQRLGEARPAECEVLECQPQRLGIRELPFEQIEGRLERRELLVLELELRQEVLLGAERVQLLARELVTLRLQRHPERQQLRTVGIEASRECFVRHLGVALDVRLDVARGQGTSFCHEERHQRKLADQLVRVM